MSLLLGFDNAVFLTNNFFSHDKLIFFALQINFRRNQTIEVHVSLRSMIFTNHGVLINYFYKTLFHSLQFSFQAANIFFFGGFELFEDLLLSLKLSINVFMLCLCFTDRSLKLLVLSS